MKQAAAGRRIRCGWTVSTFVVAIMAAGPAWTAPRHAPAAIVQREEAGRVVFRVLVPQPTLKPSTALPGAQRLEIRGYDRLGAPGAPPTLSRWFFVGLPPEGAYSLSFRVISSTPLGTHQLEPVGTPVGIQGEDLGPGLSERVVWSEDAFLSYRDPATVSADSVVYVRHQRALPVRVNPVSYDPGTRSLSVAREIEVEVRFAAPPAGEASAPVRRGTSGWDEAFGRLFVNAGQAARWRPVSAIPFESSSAAGARVAPGAVKVRVYATGIHTVRASRAIAKGFPAGQPIAQLRLFRRLYTDATLSPTEAEVAFSVDEDPTGTAGTFDAADKLVFYGRRLRDDNTQGDLRESFSSYNAYWLEPSAGTRMVESTPPPGFVSADTAATAFPVTSRRFEIDNIFREGTPNETYDIYYFNYGYEAGPIDMPFSVDTVQPGTNLSLAAEIHGHTYDQLRGVRLSLFNSKGESNVVLYTIPAKARRVFTASIPAEDLDVGENQFRMARPDNSRSSLNVVGNYVEVSYSSLYRARGNTLRFNSASLAGDTSLTVTGITNTNGLDLFDITDPLRPERLTPAASNFQPATGGTALSFRATLAGRREYLLLPKARMIDVIAADVVADTPSAIIGGAAESGIDVLVVSHHEFLDGMREWASYRRAQGYRVLLVDVEDVFDEFNGGVPNARAVQRFARHFFEHADASSLVLVGDASEDHKHIFPNSGPDFVPTFHRVDVVSELQKDEVVTTDKRLVKFPGPGGTDFIPDMIVGRIPVGDSGELRSVLDKVYAYEAPKASDFWRKRMIIVSDDTFSEGSSSFGQLNFQHYDAEIPFETGQEEVAQTIENSLPAGYDVVRFFLGRYTDAFYPPHPPGTSPTYPRRDAIRKTRAVGGITDKLMSELNQGATWVAIQSHMNRFLVTHESVLCAAPGSFIDSPTGKDHLRVENRFKPWIIFGMGCHFSEYALNDEQSPENVVYNAPNGDGFAEQFLFQDERGAVGTYGSSGFEYLTANNNYMSRIADVWFYDAPYDTMINQTQAEWKFGQLMFLTEAQMAPSQPQPVERYHILGDPLLRIDAGPPAFDVSVNGRPAQSGDLVGGGSELDTLRVEATVTDENALHKFGLEIDGQDTSDSLTVEALVDPQLPHARQYKLSFRHLVMPRTYDIILRAYQAPDTTAGQYHMAAEFVLKVESSIIVTVNGRQIESGADVPVDGNYRIDLAFPVFIPSSDIVVSIDDVAIPDVLFAHPSAEDSLAWIITFRKQLGAGKHHMLITAQDIEFSYQLNVSEITGLDHVINYPNPFGGDGTRFVYTNEVEITEGTIDIYTVSGKKVRRLEIPSTARLPGQNSVFWDGRDGAGGALANGVYLYVINAKQRGGSTMTRGTANKIE